MPIINKPQFPLIDAKSSLQNLYAPYNPSVIPQASVTAGRDDPDIFGWVDSGKDPYQVVLNKTANMSLAPHVLPHELEHVLQNKVAARYGTTYDKQVMGQLKQPNGLSTLIGALSNSLSNKEIPKYFQEKYKYPIKYYGTGLRGELNLQEQWAEISAAEQYLKKDLTKDPFVRKHMFGDDEDLIKAYKATTGLRTDRWDARDLPPMTIPLEPPLPVAKKKEQSFLERMFGQ